MRRLGFTLLEVLATLLMLSVGIASVIGMVRYGIRLSGEAQEAHSAMPTALTVLCDPTPSGLTADLNDADGDGWKLEAGSTLAAPATGDYAFTVSGTINGYWVKRVEASKSSDILDRLEALDDRSGSYTADDDGRNGRVRAAMVTVEVYRGLDDAFVTTVQQRILRRKPAP
jgi:prepilin-type N-terminal cleavage/methylation domain-containing protein